jgi:hypothetical protein
VHRTRLALTTRLTGEVYGMVEIVLVPLLGLLILLLLVLVILLFFLLLLPPRPGGSIREKEKEKE